jgi:hypothetical protein
MKMKWMMVQLFFAAVLTFLAVGSLEAVLGDFSSAVWWAPRIQGVEEFSSGTPSTAPARHRCRDPEVLLVIFALVWVFL